MTDEAESFLRRWARLKSEQSTPQAPEPAPPASLPQTASPAPEAQAVAPEDLPPIEELTAESDFTPFLRAGVPEELKRRALRKLWRSDPVFANLDGLVEYGEDFAAAFRNPGPIATLFQIGRGMPGPDDLEETQSAAEPKPDQAEEEAERDRATPKQSSSSDPPTAAADDLPAKDPNAAG